MEVKLYLSCFRHEALIASQLEPTAFGRYMAVGTQKLTRGAYMFFEVSRRVVEAAFRLQDIEERCAPHADGSPKASKYVSIYRVLEHVPREALGKLHLVTADGRVLTLEPSSYDAAHETPSVGLYQQLCPVSPLIVSALSPAAFGKFITDAEASISLPRLFFADLSLDRDDDGRLAGHLPYSDPLHIEQCIRELHAGSDKQSKTVSRLPNIVAFYRTIRRGFFVADAQGLKHYGFPPTSKLETEHPHWWRSAQMS